MTVRVRRFLARRGPSDFSRIVAGVQPAEVGAVKSALFKDRERGTVRFGDGKYELVENKKPPAADRSATGGSSFPGA